MPLYFFIKSLRKVKGKRSWIFLGKFFQVFSLDIDRNALGPVPLHFFSKSLPNFMENAPGASWANSSLFLLDPFQILLETIHKAPWAKSFTFLH